MTNPQDRPVAEPLSERILRFAFNARRFGVKETAKNEGHVCTPVFEDGHGFAMFPITMFEEAGMALERLSKRVEELEAVQGCNHGAGLAAALHGCDSPGDTGTKESQP